MRQRLRAIIRKEFLQTVWYDFPATYHGDSGAFAFADGHSETKRWKDPNIRKPVSKVSTTGFISTPSDAGSGDLKWVQDRTTVLK